jgi:hypothetical protein
MVDPRSDYDSPWKEILEAYFRDFIGFFFPHIEPEIAWERGYDFLDKELQQVVRDAELGRRYADKLVKVWRGSGEEAWVMTHIEIQGQEETHFTERMFTYNYRLRDCYNRSIASLAVLGDERSTWRPRSYIDELWVCRIQFDFPVVKLLDYGANWSDLENNPNPFALVVMAHLKAKETRSDDQERKAWKFSLTRRLYEQGYERQDILNLYRFIDWLLVLLEGLEREFQEDLQRFEQERQMQYVTSIERMAMQEGSKQEARSLVLRLLTRRVGSVPEFLQTQIEALSLAQLEDLGEALLEFSRPEDLESWLQAHSPE